MMQPLPSEEMSNPRGKTNKQSSTYNSNAVLSCLSHCRMMINGLHLMKLQYRHLTVTHNSFFEFALCAFDSASLREMQPTG